LSQVLEAKAVKPDENAMYLYTNFLEMIWPYDDRGRLIGEDVGAGPGQGRNHQARP
jgi:hypothetical protein